MGHLPKIVTGEVVYYILSGTPRAPQKCFWPHLRVEFSGENHLLLICGKMPNQTWWITKYLDSGLNSDLFKKKKFQIGHVWTVKDNKFWTFFENGSHFWTALTLQLVDGFGQTFFLNRSEFHLEFKYLVSCKVWFGIFPQINKR